MNISSIKTNVSIPGYTFGSGSVSLAKTVLLTPVKWLNIKSDILNEEESSGKVSPVAEIDESECANGISINETNPAAKADDSANIKIFFNMFFILKFPLYINKPIK